MEPRTWSQLSALEKSSLVPIAFAAGGFIWGVARLAEAYPALVRPAASVLGVAALVLAAVYGGCILLLRGKLPAAGTLRLFGLNLLGALFITAFVVPFHLMLLGALGPLQSTTTVLFFEVEAPLLDRIAIGIVWLLLYALDLVVVMAWIGAIGALFRALVRLVRLD